MTREPGATAGRLAAWLALVVVLAVVVYASYLLAEDAGPSADPSTARDLFVGGLVQDSLLLGTLLLIVRGGPARELLALRRPRSWLRAAGWTLGVPLVAIWILGAILSRSSRGRRARPGADEVATRGGSPLSRSNLAFTCSQCPSSRK